MSSFYGGLLIGSSGEGGTTDYNQLNNIPITNLIGTESSPIIWSDLNYGLYTIKGSYQYNSNGEVFRESYSKYIEISQDSTTLQKVVKFNIIENGNVYIVTLSYDEEGAYTENKVAISSTIAQSVAYTKF